MIKYQDEEEHFERLIKKGEKLSFLYRKNYKIVFYKKSFFRRLSYKLRKNLTNLDKELNYRGNMGTRADWSPKEQNQNSFLDFKVKGNEQKVKFEKFQHLHCRVPTLQKKPDPDLNVKKN